MATKWTKYLGDSVTVYLDKSATVKDAMKTVLDIEDDAAHVNWGGDWRMPTKDEFDDLLKNCIWIKTKLNGINGYKAISKKVGYENKWIFFPFTDFRVGTELYSVGKDGQYWSNSLYSKKEQPFCATILELEPSNKEQVRQYRTLRFYGITIRPVCP